MHDRRDHRSRVAGAAGPAGRAQVMARVLARCGAEMRFMDVSLHGESDHGELWISRSGYTGEDGFEISVASRPGRFLRAHCLPLRVAPIGLGARDSLRLEAGLCLYGHDIDTGTSPVEAALGWAIQKVRRRAANARGRLSRCRSHSGRAGGRRRRAARGIAPRRPRADARGHRRFTPHRRAARRSGMSLRVASDRPLARRCRWATCPPGCPPRHASSGRFGASGRCAVARRCPSCPPVSNADPMDRRESCEDEVHRRA